MDFGERRLWSSAVAIATTQLMTPADDTMWKEIQANNPQQDEIELHRAAFDLQKLNNQRSEFTNKEWTEKWKIDVLISLIALKNSPVCLDMS